MLTARLALATTFLMGSTCVFAAGSPTLRLPTASIALTPSGATLAPGATLQFAAQPLDRNGDPVPDINVAWSSNRSRTVSINSQGLATANAVGTAVLTARAAGKSATASVSVARPLTAGTLVAANVGQVNHVLVDDEWVFWTETSGTLVRVRKTPRAGGPIYDLASEKARTSRGVAVTYVHLKQIGENLYWSRETFGALDHWSIRRVAKSGGPVSEVLAEDIGIEPMLSNGWAVAGKYIVAPLWAPARLDLPNNTRVAAYDSDTGMWAPLLQGVYGDNGIHIVAGTEGSVYLRSVTDQPRTDILRIDPAGPVNSHEVLRSEGRRDARLAQPGAVTETELLYWTQSGDGSRLMALPLAGGTPRTVVRGLLGHGLVTDGNFLYWAPLQREVVKLPIAGGTPTRLQQRIVANPPYGGLALDPAGLFLARLETGNKAAIVRIDK